MKLKRIIVVGLTLLLLSSACTQRDSFDARLRSIVKPYLFSITGWEINTLSGAVRQTFTRPVKVDDEVGTVRQYFANVAEIRSLESELEVSGAEDRGKRTALEAELNRLRESQQELAGPVERILRKQLTGVLTEEAIFSPVRNIKIHFPPVSFKLEKPPNALVVSLRDRIDSIREITLQPDLALSKVEDIEAGVDNLDVSSLVVGLGGLAATYPALVDNDEDLRPTLEAIAHEWTHQYLTFKPLGFLYLLDVTGISRNYEVATIDETVASMVGSELGTLVYEKYYAQYDKGDSGNQTVETGFDFDREMREIRRAVDAYLAKGEIDQAEQFMESRRQYLVAQGYYIRKLNQAYFAFYGTYADSPTSISPIGLALKQLRGERPSLKDFLNTAAGMTSQKKLEDTVK
ncbi:MAG: hypothetical protein ABIH70_01060 [Chloroflexota bacterium]